ncbi:MAG: long-chain fatty acid--CoA ligase, partial [Proteobacteria bacterium]|nr:long-chain fatty acid--CoA ligase [Pseudomonadota bacterium]
MSKNDQLTEYTIPQLLRWRVGQTPDRPALREKDFGIWNTYTWKDYYKYVKNTALGLKAIGLGKGDTIALISDNIPEILFTAIAAHSIGAISAGIYQTSMPHEIAQILGYLKVSAVFCDNQEQVDKVLDVRDQIPNVKKVIFEDPRGMREY